MDTIAVLYGFMQRIRFDPEIGPAHISVFASLLQIYSEVDSGGLLMVRSDEVVGLAKVSRRVYYSCVKTLARKGFIGYEPSFDPAKGSVISLLQYG